MCTFSQLVQLSTVAMSTRARGKRRGPDPQQLTLYAYQTKRSRVESSSESSDSSVCDPFSNEDDSDSHNGDDTTVAVNKNKATVSGDETVHQDNHITLDKPSGSMIIYIQ